MEAVAVAPWQDTRAVLSVLDFFRVASAKMLWALAELEVKCSKNSVLVTCAALFFLCLIPMSAWPIILEGAYILDGLQFAVS